GAEQRLSDAVNGFIGSRDLTLVVQRLISIAFQLEVEEKCPTAAKLIASVVERQIITANLQAIAAAHRDDSARSRVDGIGDTAEGAIERFALLTGGTRPKRQIHARRIRPRVC